MHLKDRRGYLINVIFRIVFFARRYHTSINMDKTRLIREHTSPWIRVRAAHTIVLHSSGPV
jgi:hypothetical protein